MSCPHPEKNAYASKKRAKLALRRGGGVKQRDTITVYRCLCGAWHLGHKQAAA